MDWVISFLYFKTNTVLHCSLVMISCQTLCDPMDCRMPGFPVLHHIPEFAQAHVSWFGGDIQPSYPLSPPSSPALNLSQHRGLFQWVGSLHQVTKVLEPQHQSFQWIFRIDWFDLLAVQGTLKSLLQHYSSWVSVLQCSAFFMVQLSHLYMTAGKPIALSIWTFVGKMISLLFNVLSRFVIAFLPRSKCFLTQGCSHHLWWFWTLRK